MSMYEHDSPYGELSDTEEFLFEAPTPSDDDSTNRPLIIDDEPLQDKTQTQMSIPGASFNFINSILGSGIIGLPFAIRQSGLGMGIIVMVAVACMCDYTSRLLINCGLKTRKWGYEQLADHCFGATGFYTLTIFSFLFDFGALCSYVVMLGDTIPATLEHWFPGTLWGNRYFMVVLIAVVIMLPLCLLRDMSSLAFTSMLSIFTVFVMVAIVVARGAAIGFDPYREEPCPLQPVDDGEDPWAFVRASVVSGFGTMSFAFVSHDIIFSIYNTVKNPTPFRWGMVSTVSIQGACVVSMLFAVCGYLTFFLDTQGNVLNNFFECDPDDVWIIITRFLLGITMIFTYPMIFFVGRRYLFATFFRGQSYPTNLQHYLLSAILFVATLAVGLYATELGVVLELTGSFTASLIGYMLPVAIYFHTWGLKAVWVKQFAAWKKGHRDYEPKLTRKVLAVLHFWLPILVFIFGIISFVVGTGLSIYDLVDSGED